MTEQQEGLTKEQFNALPYQEKMRRIIDVLSQAKSIARQNLKGAKTFTDFLMWHRAVLWSDPQYNGWMFEYEPNLTPEETLTDYSDPKRIKELGFEKDARYALEMKAQIDQLPEQQGQVRVALKRYRDKLGTYTYRVLAAFPKGIQEWDLIADSVVDAYPNRGLDFIYYDPANACVDHAADDLFRVYRDKPFYIENRDLMTAISGLQTDNRGVYEYQLEKTEQGAVKQSSTNYILVGLIGGFSNEPYRARVSDFWSNRPMAPNKTHS